LHIIVAVAGRLAQEFHLPKFLVGFFLEVDITPSRFEYTQQTNNGARIPHDYAFLYIEVGCHQGQKNAASRVTTKLI
jgi:hypothetical protein